MGSAEGGVAGSGEEIGGEGTCGSIGSGAFILMAGPPHVMGRLWQKNLHDGLVVGWWKQRRLGRLRVGLKDAVDEGGQEGLDDGQGEC